MDSRTKASGRVLSDQATHEPSLKSRPDGECPSRDDIELVEVRLILGVRPMSSEERKEEGDPFFDEDEEGAVSYAIDDLADGIAALLDDESEYAREALAGSGHFITVVSARSGGADLVSSEEVGLPA